MTYDDPAVAAIAFAIETETDDGITFLRCWFSGDFDVIQREWPDAPEEVFIGADLLHPQTKARLERIERLRGLDADRCRVTNSYIIDNARLAEQLAAAQARIELLEHDAQTGDYETLYAQTVCELQAAQAREAKLRRWIATSPVVITHDDEIAMAKERKREILAMSTDDTTLKERLAQERERCAKVFSQWTRDGRWAANVIRNLGDE